MNQETRDAETTLSDALRQLFGYETDHGRIRSHHHARKIMATLREAGFVIHRANDPIPDVPIAHLDPYTGRLVREVRFAPGGLKPAEVRPDEPTPAPVNESASGVGQPVLFVDRDVLASLTRITDLFADVLRAKSTEGKGR